MPGIVSLVPSATETLVALGASPVGCTRFCKQAGIETFGGTKNPDVKAIVRLGPEAVVVNDEENRREDVDALEGAGVRTVSVSPRSVEDVGGAVAALADLGDVSLPEMFEDAAWKQWVEQQRQPPSRRVFVPIWTRPWMTLNGATYGSSVLEALGAVNVYAGAADRYPKVEIDEAAALAPDLVLLPTEPYPFRDRHVARVAAAFPGATVSLVDGEDLFWWGSRTPHAVRRLTHFLASL